MERNFLRLFDCIKPVIGMVHLAGRDRLERVERGLEELALYQRLGVNGAIVEDYHGHPEDVIQVVSEGRDIGLKNIVLGANILRNPYKAFSTGKYGVKFVQFDSVEEDKLDVPIYDGLRKQFGDLAVIGGVRFKYQPYTGNSLEDDLEYAREKCEAIVTTGDATGVETPIKKLREFKDKLRGYPLVVGAGVNLDNVREQLLIADAAIVGTYFKKNGDTQMPLDDSKIKALMSVVKQLRREQWGLG